MAFELNRGGTCHLDFLFDMQKYFPDALFLEIKRMFALCRGGERVEEIRLRGERRAYLTIGFAGKKKNLATDVILRSDELSVIFERMCDGSLYAFSESIAKGYISLQSGIRVGVCGRAALENGKIFGVYDISALNVRIPRSDIHADSGLLDIVRKNALLGQGVLMFSPPAQGKTTCLRSLSYALASGDEPMRVSVIDTRGELSLMPSNSSLSLDTLVGYPKAEGIRIATLFMNPEVIVCDEIGSEDEAMAIVDAQNCGVPLIASTHGASLSTVMLKNGIAALHRAHVFGAYIALSIGACGGFEYSAFSWEAAERELDKNNRCAHSNS